MRGSQARCTRSGRDGDARQECYLARMSRAQRTGGGATTDDLGQFRLWGLNAGEVIIVADARANSFLGPNAPPETEADRTGYVTTYYPGTLDEGMAERVRVKIGEETPGIDIRVGQARLYHISGFVVDSKGRPLANANGQLMRRGPTVGVAPLFAMSLLYTAGQLVLSPFQVDPKNFLLGATYLAGAGLVIAYLAMTASVKTGLFHSRRMA